MQQPTETIAAIAIAMALIELIKFILSKFNGQSQVVMTQLLERQKTEIRLLEEIKNGIHELPNKLRRLQ